MQTDEVQDLLTLLTNALEICQEKPPISSSEEHAPCKIVSTWDDWATDSWNTEPTTSPRSSIVQSEITWNPSINTWGSSINTWNSPSSTSNQLSSLSSIDQSNRTCGSSITPSSLDSMPAPSSSEEHAQGENVDTWDDWGSSITSSSLDSMPAPSYHSLIRHFKIVLLGDPSTGKTSYLQWLQTQSFSKMTLPSTQLEVAKLTLSTSIGDITLDLWNVPGDVSQTIFNHFDVFCIQKQGALLFFDLTRPATYRTSIPSFYSVFQRVAEGPVVLVGTKVDCRDRRLKKSDINFHRKKNLHYYEISVKSGHNITKPLLSLLRSLTGVAELKLLSFPEW